MSQAIIVYTKQVREKFLSLKKDAKVEVVAEFEEVCAKISHLCIMKLSYIAGLLTLLVVKFLYVAHKET